MKSEKRKRLSPMQREDRRDFWFFLSPWIVGFTFFGAGPILAAVFLSFTDYSIFTRPHWVGLANYRELLFQDPLVPKALFNTLFYTVFAVPLGTFFSLMVALLLNQKVKGLPVWRTLYYLPTVVSGVAMGVLWRWIFNPEVGLLNTALRPLLQAFGLSDPKWLLDPHLAKPAYVLMSLWGIGGGMIIFLAGLQSIPKQLYEAAEIDGAGRFSQFRHVTLPLLSPVVFFSLTMGFIGSFQIFTQAYVMTGRGVDNSTLFYVLYLFDQAFRYFRMGYSSALAWVLFAIVLVITLVQFRLARRWVYYEGAAS
ncbi:MAG: sugar ABC transporter permease [Kiritimatiellaeota bacterium]|nr:sugar ABC transporter permease [Kiritimatiellota bacterium]